MSDKEWKPVDPVSIDDLTKRRVIFVSGDDPLMIRSAASMENIFIGCGIASQKEALRINNEIIQPGSDALLFLYIRPEYKPKQNEGPINVDTHLTGGGSVSPMFKPESHWPNAYWYPEMQQISGISFSDVFKEMKESGKSVFIPSDKNLPFSIIMSCCNGNNVLHNISIRNTGSCHNCNKPIIDIIPK